MDFSIEEYSMNSWPSLKTSFYDGWVLRFANGYTKRANSIISLYPSHLPLQKKVEVCESIYHKQNLPVLYKILDCDEHRLLDRYLSENGYDRVDPTSVMILSDLSGINAKSQDIILSDYFTESWIQGFSSSYQLGSEDQNTFRQILNHQSCDVIVATYKSDDRLTGFGFGTLIGTSVGIFGIYVDEKFRRRGIGRNMVSSILAEAYQRGYHQSYLQVFYENHNARKIYHKLGYQDSYTYWYRRKIF